MNSYYITNNNEKVYLKPKEYLNISNKNIVELVIPYGCNIVDCSHNKIKKLVVPDNVHTLYCSHNEIEELILPKKINTVFCYKNKLIKLVVPNSIKYVTMSYSSEVLPLYNDHIICDETQLINLRDDITVFSWI